MLVLTRFKDQRIMLRRGDEEIVLTVCDIRKSLKHGMTVRLGIDADREWVIVREELLTEQEPGRE